MLLGDSPSAVEWLTRSRDLLWTKVTLFLLSFCLMVSPLRCHPPTNKPPTMTRQRLDCGLKSTRSKHLAPSCCSHWG
ncbi:hypothetical protein PF001_g28467 [Phytophthora fragariae]|uniref:Uncharacterized protein n=1 Tax=Phytophthora fragariae TaxID=53985 RepID=A0A6A4BDT3_9STRA|nr:hypothetical protein PF001_g28467 [Phytophthora fragariae]